MIKLYISP